MPFYFTCPYCFKKTLVDESLAGQAGPCVSCGKSVVIPAPPASHPAAARPVDSPTVRLASPSTLTRRTALAWTLKGAGLVLGVLFFSGITIYLLWPTLEGLKTRRDKVACMNNLNQIARALNAYAAKYGTYPPPIVYDATGKPMHSWRVLILEQLGEAALHAQYNFDQPWDSQDNINLLGQRCPRVYISPAISGSRSLAEANYFLVTGPGTLFPASGPLGPQDIRDVPANTLLVVESDNTMIEWTKPVDIDFAKLNSRIGATGANTIGGTHPGGATVVFADGQPAWLPSDLAPVLLDALISPNGGEPVDPSRFELQ